jgi:hypothetical protein
MDNAANNGNRQRGGDFPEPSKEQDKCREFLTNFISNNSRKYYDQLVRKQSPPVNVSVRYVTKLTCVTSRSKRLQADNVRFYVLSWMMC